ncbi:MAG: hypothetical protein B7Y45_13835 [Sphingomonas sp. 28-66-16]|nr:MAG: hypothetical protein B7Y45_13835 [Sphingomonas sp. 28-66-16]
MDTLRGFEDDRSDIDYHDEEDMRVDDNQNFEIGSDERRMQVRAYNYWVSLLGGRAYPSIEDLDPENIADFGPHSVLLDFTAGIEDPAIQFLGKALRNECDLEPTMTRINQVPSRSLLSRLTDHYLQIIANRAPIGFEAEFVSMRGHNTMYRGILMPFSSDGETIDFIYGVINWKELIDAAAQARLDSEVAAAIRAAPRPSATAPAWASGPGGDLPRDDDDAETMNRGEGDRRLADTTAPGDARALVPGGASPAQPLTGLPTSALADQLALAQQTAAAVRAADTRSRAALYRALGRAHDFACSADADPKGLAMLLDRAAIAAQARAPLTPIVKLVFGADYDKTRLTEFAAVLGHARRCNVPVGALADFLEMAEGGIKGIVQAERALRRPAASRDPAADARAMLRARPVLARVSIAFDAGDSEFVLLVARTAADGAFDIVGAVPPADPVTARALVRVAP